MPHLRRFIADNPTSWLRELVDTYKISAVSDNQETPRLVSLKYDQIESPMHEPVVQECRGAVVDLKTSTILALPYFKFWNMYEHLAAEIDWSRNPRVQEKLDGSLMILHYDPVQGSWSVASSGHPVAGGRVGKEDMTFSQLFWKTFSALEMELPTTQLGRETSFMFELCCQENRIVVRHDQPRLVLHGARHVPSEKEWDRLELESDCLDLNWEIVKEYRISTAEEALQASKELDPVQTEGFVVVDDAFNRVKIKSPRYVALHHLISGFNPRRALELWQAGEVSEVLVHFPELTTEVTRVTDALEKVAELAFQDYLKYKDLPTRKEYAAAVKDKPWSSICFKLLAESSPTVVTAVNIVRSMTTSAAERLIGV